MYYRVIVLQSGKIVKRGYVRCLYDPHPLTPSPSEWRGRTLRIAALISPSPPCRRRPGDEGLSSHLQMPGGTGRVAAKFDVRQSFCYNFTGATISLPTLHHRAKAPLSARHETPVVSLAVPSFDTNRCS